MYRGTSPHWGQNDPGLSDPSRIPTGVRESTNWGQSDPPPFKGPTRSGISRPGGRLSSGAEPRRRGEGCCGGDRWCVGERQHRGGNGTGDLSSGSVAPVPGDLVVAVHDANAVLELFESDNNIAKWPLVEAFEGELERYGWFDHRGGGGKITPADAVGVRGVVAEVSTWMTLDDARAPSWAPSRAARTVAAVLDDPPPAPARPRGRGLPGRWGTSPARGPAPRAGPRG